LISVMSHYVNSCYSTDMDKFYAVYLSVIIVGKQTCMIPRDPHHTPSMAAYKMIRLKFELACKSSITKHSNDFTYS